MYLVYVLFNILLNWEVAADIVYWIMLLFAPFSLLDCFVKISSRHLGFVDETYPGKLKTKKLRELETNSSEF